MAMRDRPQRMEGFTLVEAMVVVTILGLLLAAAAPSFQNSNQRRRVESAARELGATLQVARQRTVATRIPHRVVANVGDRVFWTERSLNDSSWVRDPDLDHVLPHGVNWSFQAGGDPANSDVEFESRGTVVAVDAPLTARFANAEGDSFVVSAVRTGRVIVRAGSP